MQTKEVPNVFWSSNPTETMYWFDKPLTYTIHASDRCIEREIPPVDFLPISSKLVDCVRDAKGNPVRLTFKVNIENPYYIAISAQGVVLTVFRQTKKKSIIHHDNIKNKKKRYVQIYNKVFGSADHEFIPKYYRTKYW
jgi:hypothetical protein